MTRTEPAAGPGRAGPDPARRLTRRGARATVALALALVTASALIAVEPAAPAHATSYPSWHDVQKAKAHQKTASKKVDEINGLISSLETKVKDTQAEAEERGEEAAKAQDAYDAADQRATTLEKQADASAKKAKQATSQAGKLAAQLYRTGGANLTMNIFLSGGRNARTSSPDRLLADLGSMTKLVETSSGIYRQAEAATHTADALTAQAKVAEAERARLKKKADAALDQAIAAAASAKTELSDEEDHIQVLKAQLAALKDKTKKTVAGYEKGVEARRKAAAAAARKAAAAAARNAGHVSSSGWAVPANGPITDGFGPRPSPCAGCTSWHMGIDIGAGYNAPIYAAHSGTVQYAGPMDGYGNFVLLNHGGGIQTAYGHIRPGGILVHIGQHVSAGQVIARVGTTGNSTGYHLHFEVRINGARVNGIPFMRQRGAPLG